MGGVDSNGVGANHIQQAGGAHTETLLVLIKQLHDHHNRYQRQQQRDSKQPGTDRHCYLHHPSHSGRDIQLNSACANERGTLVAASRTDTPDGLPLCQFVHLYCCGLAGKKTFTACIQRSVVLPAFTARCRQLLPLSHRPSRGDSIC